MKRTLAVVVLSAFVCVGLLGGGCGQETSSGGGRWPEGRNPSVDVQPSWPAGGELAEEQDVEASYPERKTCRVCGKGPLKADVSVDVIQAEGGSKRMYFDREECLKKFKERTDDHWIKGASPGEDN